MASATVTEATQDYSPEIQEALARLATYHCNLARKEGQVSITETKRGCVEFSYEKGVYTLTKHNYPVVEILAAGKPAQVKPVLVALYTVG